MREHDWAYSKPIVLLDLVWNIAFLAVSISILIMNLDIVAKHLESANTMFSFIWWIIGFYWVSAGGQRLTSFALHLWHLMFSLLSFGLAVCCCLPCIIAILYAVADQEGATKEDIEKLPRYNFRKIGDLEKQNSEIQGSFGGTMTECDTESPSENALPLEDANAAYALVPYYDDGAELRELPIMTNGYT
ncbi:hypothetical protein CASFOL_034199 [Castilleja foliolosa]|uniref:RING-type E3 ubiquitin transferase n=1 Tax=Castilleja foliolosa TaxID=1961234 RepID=A0ABD3BWT9_9LAMI